MIPEFPNFKKIEFSDKKAVENFTLRFCPYSDFNFISMWSWNVKEEMAISRLENTLIVRFNDYLTGEPFYSFLGHVNVNETAQKLIDYSLAEGIQPTLKLVPQESVQNLDLEKFELIEDTDHADYVLSIKKLMPHDGSTRPLSTRRRLINKFREKEKFNITLIDAHDINIQNEIFKVFEKWENQLEMPSHEIDNLRLALHRLFKIKELKPTISFGIYINDKLSGYSINEILGDGYAMGHFQQADLSDFEGMYALLMQESAPYLDNLGCKYINIEQDLGIGGLKKWKASYKPEFFLRKYQVSLRG
jgi:uncharacterized protein